MGFLRSFLRRHFAGKPVVASRNVGWFVRLAVLSKWEFSIGGSRTTDWWNCILLVQREGYRYAYKHVILHIITMKDHSFTTNTNRTNSKACWSHDFTIRTRWSTQILNFTTWTSGELWTKNIGQNVLHSKTTRWEGGEKRRRERVLGIVTPILVQRQALISSVAAKLGHETKKTCSNRVPDMTCFAAKHLKFDSRKSKLSRQR